MTIAVDLGRKATKQTKNKRFKAINHLQSLENLRFLLPPLILRLYTGCRLDQNFSKSVIVFQKVKVLNY